MNHTMINPKVDYQQLAENISLWGRELGFSDVGISDIDLSTQETYLKHWLEQNYHGEMAYMARHGSMRSHPEELEPGTLRVISVRLDYLPENASFAKILDAKDHAYISRYALGRDYHKMMRKRLQLLGKKIAGYCAELNYRPFVDSAPVLERPLAEKAGLGWVGKHSLLISPDAGSWFFLGELFVDIPLPLSEDALKTAANCGDCVACINICPTNAIVKPYVVDARRCISYLTIESAAPIPEELRPMLGNRIYGCDDCQLTCPWNKYATISQEDDFHPRHKLDWITLIELFQWSEKTFLTNLQGSPIRRIGYQSWQRNIAVALGNAYYSEEIISALEYAKPGACELVAEHIQWAITRQLARKTNGTEEPDNKLEQLIRTVKKISPRDA